jgi:hypothetical protein
MKTRKFIATLLLIGILILPSSLMAQAEPPSSEPDVGIKVLDLLIVRPIGLAVSGVTTGFFLATLPITFPIGVSEASARIFVEAPWRFTGARPLGHFDRYKDGKPITVVPDN